MSSAGPQSIFWALFSLKGRIRRMTFFWGLLAPISLLILCFIQILVAFHRGNAFGMEMWAVLTLLMIVITLYCILALAVKRLHDIGRSGWWAVLGIVFLFLFFIGLLFLCLYPGEENDNQFGPPPVLS